MDAWTTRSVLGGLIYQENRRKMSDGNPAFYKRVASMGILVDQGQPVQIDGPKWEITSSPGDDEDNVASTLDLMYNDMYGVYQDINDIQNTLFNHAGSMLYCRFVDALVLRKTCDQSYLHHAFDLMVPLTREERIKCITGLNKVYWESFSGVVSVRIDQTWTDLEMVPLSTRSSVSYQDISFTACIERQDISLTVRNYQFRTFRNEKARVQAMRIHAAESSLLPRSSMYMLTDKNIPLDIIPGVAELSTLKRLGLDKDMTSEAKKLDIRERLLKSQGPLSMKM